MKKIALFTIVLLVATACKKDKASGNSNPLLYAEYITSFSGGLASATDPVQISLNKPIVADDLEKVGAMNLFDISPKVKGSVVAVSPTQLRFVPDERLKQNTQYTVTFHLSKLFDVKSDLKEFVFSFKTKAQAFSLELGELQSYNKDLYFLSGTLSANDAISQETAKELFKANLNNRAVSVKFSGGGNGTSFAFIADSIVRGSEAASLDFHWNKKIALTDDDIAASLKIPAQGTFDIVQTLTPDDTNQSFWINFTEPLDKNQNFNGLVDLVIRNSYTQLRYSVNGNILKVYSDTPLEGNYELKIRQGIRGIYGSRLTSDKDMTVWFAPRKPEIKLVRSGTILPSSENLKINFQTVNLRAVNVEITRIFENNVLQFLQENPLGGTYQIHRVGKTIARKVISFEGSPTQQLKRWNTYALDLSSIIQPEPGAIYRVTFSMQRNYSLYHCGDEELPPLDTSFEKKPLVNNDNYYDSDYYYDDWSYDDWGNENDPCKKSYYAYKKVETNILASDMGVIIKRGQDNNYTAIVNSIITTEPINEATVAFYDFQQQKLKELKTDSEGMAFAELKEKAYFASVKKGNNTTYVKIEDGLSLSMSKYDVDGVRLQKGLNGYIYTERGVWRPGDSIFVGFILNDFNAKNPEKLPVKLIFKDPYGKIIAEQMQSSNALNHYAFTLTTPPDALTGNWEVFISAGVAKFRKSIKIETIKPNRLKIENSLNEKTIFSEGTQANINVQWLQGTPLANAAVNIKAKYYASEATFKGFEEYSFTNKAFTFSEQEMPIFDGRTDAQGNVSFRFTPNGLQSPSMLKVNFLTQANEGGGDFSTDVSSATVSPYRSYAGIKPAKAGKYGYYDTKNKYSFGVASVSENGKPISGKQLKISIFKTNWNWWWDASRNNISSYNSSQSQNVYYTNTVSTNANGVAQFTFEVPSADAGSFFILVSDTESGHNSGISAYFYGWGRPERGGSEAVMLSIATDKKEYAVGEKATVTFPSDKGSRALLSVENSSGIVETHWVTTHEGETNFSLPITDKMTPNVYLNITLLQPHANTANDSPIRLYGVSPISVINKNTELKPQLQMPDVLRPQQKATVKVSEASGKPMVYTLAIVEDGLLDLTRFKTPNPWKSFFSKTALGVKTWDVYDDIIGAYGGTINQAFSIGGDEELAGGEAQKANRFKPLVIFKGPFELKKGKTDTHQIEIPNYIGSARVMVVASDVANNAYGSAEKNVPIRSPLMVLGSLPRKAVPGEKIILPVTVFAMENHVKNVSLSVQTNEQFAVEGKKSQSLQFQNTGEQMAYFELDTKSEGIGKITVTATSGNEKATYEVEMDIYNPNPITYITESYSINAGASATLEGNIFGNPEDSRSVLEVSSFPGINLHQRLEYLLKYPHGCLEQVTSAAFPQLYLNELVSLNAEGTERTSRNIKTAIANLYKNQLSNGGFSYWAGGRYADDWSTSYVGHFYIEAEKKGYVLPSGSKKQWIDYQTNEARNWRREARYYNDIPQAYRLYTLALAGSPEMASMNRLREMEDISNEARLRLAAAYAVIGQRKTAEGLFRSANISNSDYYYGSYTRNMAMALETALLTGKTTEANRWALEIAEKLSSSEWMSTQTTAYALYAMTQYIAVNGKGKQMIFAYTDKGKTESIKTEEPIFSKEVSLSANAKTVSFKNESQQTLFAKIISSGKLDVGQELAVQNGLSIQVEYRDGNGKLIDENRLPQGSEVNISIRVANLTNEYVENIALTQIIPSGWEIVNVRYTDYGGEQTSLDYTDYRDDRANFYFSLPSKTQKTIRLKANASYAGRYYLPGTYAEAMYDNRYNTRTAGKWVEVIR
ncbi:MAG: MG2 domain-containing protein [Capnocytophaga sp.]|nr:MG2 domain-containing protein [Capnocytophaga sp.]